MKAFSELTGYPLQDRDAFDRDEVVDYALEVKRYKDGLGEKMARDELKLLAEKFLRSHNTCTLATGHAGWIRATPLEYSYQDGFIYIITEGGEKHLYQRGAAGPIRRPYPSEEYLRRGLMHCP